MAKKANENLAFASYWDNHYIGSNDSEPTHEWFKSYSRLTNFFSDHLFSTKPPPHPTVLHLGSGDSTVPIEFHNIGYKKQTCIDFSKVVSDKMAQLHADKEIHWVVGDVRDMKQHVPDASVDIAFDKGTLDAMISGSPWDPPDFVLENTKRYIDEVVRVLKPGGIFLYITFRQPHFQKRFLLREGVWDITIESLSDGEGSFEYFGFVMIKS